MYLYLYLVYRPEPEASSGQDHSMKAHRLEILADQGDICELLGECRRCKLLLKRGKRAFLSADLIVLHLQSLLCYCGINTYCLVCPMRQFNPLSLCLMTEKRKFSSSAPHPPLAKETRQGTMQCSMLNEHVQIVCNLMMMMMMIMMMMKAPLQKGRDRGPCSMPNKDVQIANNHNGPPMQCNEDDVLHLVKL